MNARYAIGLLSLAIGLMASAGPDARAQAPAQPKDEALDSLLQKLSKPSDGSGAKAEKSAKSEVPSRTKASPRTRLPRRMRRPRGRIPRRKPRASRPSGSSGPGAGRRPAPGKPAAPKPGGSSAVSGKDKELDDLLEKLGETKETPSPDDRPQGGPGGERGQAGPAAVSTGSGRTQQAHRQGQGHRRASGGVDRPSAEAKCRRRPAHAARSARSSRR